MVISLENPPISQLSKLEREIINYFFSFYIDFFPCDFFSCFVTNPCKIQLVISKLHWTIHLTMCHFTSFVKLKEVKILNALCNRWIYVEACENYSIWFAIFLRKIKKNEGIEFIFYRIVETLRRQLLSKLLGCHIKLLDTIANYQS